MTDIIVQNISESEYSAILRQAVAVIDNTRAAVAKSVCAAVGSAHWELGKLLYDRKLDSIHGSSVVRRLSADLKERFPQMGMSPRNLWYMRRFYERFCNSDPKVQQAVALLPWSHNVLIISKNLNDDDTLFYAHESIKKGWSRDLLLNAIKLKMHETRQHALPIIISLPLCLPHRLPMPTRCSEVGIISASLG